jgi:enoyl-CoA hydratase
VIKSEARGAVTLIELDRHERRNALDTEHCDALAGAVGKAVDAGARALVITGAGSSFCAGADLTGVYGERFRQCLYGALHAITSAPVPAVAAVNGPAVGAGTQLALACDLRVAAPAAWFAVPTARHGLAVDPWTIRRLALLAGGGAARALLLGCDRLDAETARQRGLADRIGGLDDALGWAGEIAAYSPESLAYSKRALETLLEPAGWDPALDSAYEAVWEARDRAG